MNSRSDTTISLIESEWSQNRRWLSTILRARGVEPEAIEDVLQETFASALKNAAQLKDNDKFAPWLYRIAVNCALHHRRRLGRQRRLFERYQTVYASEKCDETDPLNWLLAEELCDLVRHAFKQLPSRDAELLLLKYTEGWNYRQLAEHLGLSVSSLEARLHRARKKFRVLLAQRLPDMALCQARSNSPKGKKCNDPR